ncbi:MAG: redoxin family protein [Alphaproteobacteria bacterium]|nr:redoxin family protein [Alphaproteobacteria bacterium]
MRRMFLILAPLVGFILLAIALFIGLFKDGQTLPSPLVGKTAPEIILPIFSSASGAVPVLATAKKGNNRATIVLNYFASWCVPCRAEAAALLELKRKRESAGNADIRIIGIAYKDAPDKTARFLKEYGNPYDQVFVDSDGRAGIAYGVYGIPESFLIEANGIIYRRYVGALRVDPDIAYILTHFGQN